jgi:hypothetical protein
VSQPRSAAHRSLRSSSIRPSNLRAQAEQNRQATQQLADQQQRQAEAAQTLTRESVEAYMAFMDSMFSWWQGGIQTAEKGARETEKATKGQKS